MTRLYTGLWRPRFPVLGTEFAGEVAAAGTGVRSFAKGDRVFGTLPGHGAYAEYLCLPEGQSTLAVAPANATDAEAVACCDGFLTALPYLRDAGRILAGQAVLIYGASGSVGSAAVQLAAYFGARVTGVCSTTNLDLVRSLGAETVIDYTRQDFIRSGARYDIIFDTVGKLSFARCRPALASHGVFLEAGVGLGIFPAVLWTAVIGRQKARTVATGLRPPQVRTADLMFVRGLVETGKLRPVIDRRFALEEIADAHAYVDRGHKRGNVVVNVSHS